MGRKRDKEAVRVDPKDNRIEMLTEELSKLKVKYDDEVLGRKKDSLNHNYAIERKDLKIEDLSAQKDWEIEVACNKVRKELEQAVIDSDLAATKAETALEVYKSMDNKDERKANAVNFTKLIDGITKAASSQPTINVTGK